MRTGTRRIGARSWASPPASASGGGKIEALEVRGVDVSQVEEADESKSRRKRENVLEAPLDQPIASHHDIALPRADAADRKPAQVVLTPEKQPLESRDAGLGGRSV
jgi:hypothetical protein